ncbi:MAG: hypothetical protein GX846_07720 [Deltaproteobacteria bacterium]|nr:hypothetical protein [Deltaproteobacteria bacterium]
MITAYQIRNVLRIYGNQLKKKAMIAGEGTLEKKRSADVISISGEARQKEVLRKVTDALVNQISSGIDMQLTED